MFFYKNHWQLFYFGAGLILDLDYGFFLFFSIFYCFAIIFERVSSFWRDYYMVNVTVDRRKVYNFDSVYHFNQCHRCCFHFSSLWIFVFDFKHRKSQTYLVCWSTDLQEAGLLLVVKTCETHEWRKAMSTKKPLRSQHNRAKENNT